MVRRSMIFVYAATLLLSVCVHGRSQSAADAKPDIEIIRTEWKYAGYSQIEVVKSDRSSGAGDFKVGRSTEFGFKYTATGVFRNNSKRLVSEIDWEIVFTDKKTNQPVKSFKARSKIEIKPEQTVAITRSFYLDKDLKMQTLDQADRKTLVTNVDFTDGK